MKKKLLSSSLLLATSFLLAACGNQSKDEMTGSDEVTTIEALENSTSSADIADQDTASSSASTSTDSNLTQKTVDGKELTYTYRLSLEAGNYRNDDASLIIYKDGNFSFKRPGVSSILTSENGMIRFNLEKSGSEEALTIFDNGTYAVRTDRVSYTLLQDGSFTFELKNGEKSSGEDSDRLNQLIKENKLMTVEEYLKKYEESINYIYENFDK